MMTDGHPGPNLFMRVGEFAQAAEHIATLLHVGRLPALITIDGVDGSGKSTLARALARKLRAPDIDGDAFIPGAEGLWDVEAFRTEVRSHAAVAPCVVVHSVGVSELLPEHEFRSFRIYIMQLANYLPGVLRWEYLQDVKDLELSVESLDGAIKAYHERFRPQLSADLLVQWIEG